MNRLSTSLGALLALAGLACGSADATLSQSERDALLVLREEEKLARDVYQAFDASDPMFANIRESEQRHMDSALTLLDRYGIPDPAAATAAGEFRNPALRQLYGELLAKGTPSPLAAVAVGVEIEELDIHDIATMKATTARTDVTRTYDNLTRGSRNHLRSFYGRLTSLGGSYTPRHLDDATFRSIVGSPMETGPSW